MVKTQPSNRSGLTPGQERVLGVVDASPGITIVEAAKLLGCSHATATYHLNLLARRGLVSGRRDGREVRHFVAGLTSDPQSWLTAICRDARKQAVVLLLASPQMPMTLNDMARRLGLPFGSLKRTVLQFQAQSLADLERRGFRYVVRPKPALISFARMISREVPVVVEERPAVDAPLREAELLRV